MAAPDAVAGDPSAASSGLVAALRAAVGADCVLTGAQTRPYTVDWTGRFGLVDDATAGVVVRPGDAGEVAAALRAVATAGGHVVVQGGNTGLVGGGVPVGAEVVLSTGRLRALGPIDVEGRRVVVGAGAPLAAVQELVRPQGFDVGVDLAARGSATVGGLVATNAGGERVLRYGPMRAQVLGLEVVLADGSVVDRIDVPAKDATGYDLVGLLCGSEGTLGVVTRVALRLVDRPAGTSVALVGVADVAAAVSLLTQLRAAVSGLAAAELFLADGLALVRRHTGMADPLGSAAGAYLLVEVDGSAARLAEALADASGVHGVVDAVVADDASGRERLWIYREAHTEALAAAGRPVKLDVAVPLAALSSFVDDLPDLVAESTGGLGRVVVFGHLAEGNLHVNVLDVPDGAEHAVTDAVLRRVASLGGSISAEHGVGRAKVEWLGLTRSPADIAAMRAVKDALDPAGLLGPGVLLPEVGR
jgi:FAD/FMN-containing dehydrogenase